MLYLVFLSFLLQDRLKVKDFPLSSRVSLHEWMLDMVSSCALTNEYRKMNKVCACAREERTLRLDNLMWQKLFHTEKLGWLLIDLIILLLYKDKGWMPSYLWRTKWTRLPQMREKTESILNQNGRTFLFLQLVRRETLSSNKFDISAAGAFLLLDVR